MNKKRKAIFLDRDGVINKKRNDHVKSVNELEILPLVGNAIKKFNQHNFLVIIVTNQSAINRGLTTDEKVHQIHKKIEYKIEKDDAIIDAIYICPHKPDELCSCRKPKPGLLLKAITELNIDTKFSWMIGDSNSDIQAGDSVGCKTIKIDKKTDLIKAANMILNFNNN